MPHDELEDLQRGAEGQGLADGREPVAAGRRQKTLQLLVDSTVLQFLGEGERVTARTFERQVVALHVRMVLLNRFAQIGQAQPVSVAAVA